MLKGAFVLLLVETTPCEERPGRLGSRAPGPSVERGVELPREPRAPRFAGDFRHAVVALARAREAARDGRERRGDGQRAALGIAFDAH